MKKTSVPLIGLFSTCLLLTLPLVAQGQTITLVSATSQLLEDRDDNGYYETFRLTCDVSSSSEQRVRRYLLQRNSFNVSSLALMDTANLIPGPNGFDYSNLRVTDQGTYDFRLEFRRFTDDVLLYALNYGVDPDWVGLRLEPGKVEVTVNTVGPGRPIKVDGISYTAPRTFTWFIGSQHNLEALYFQSSGTRSFFDSWSDGGAQAHSIIVLEQNTTYTAFYSTEYLLTLTPSPPAGGTIVPTPASSDSWYQSNIQVSLQANANTSYSFSGWSGDASGTANPLSFTMNSAKSVTADFTPSPTPINFGENIAGNISQAGETDVYTFSGIKNDKVLIRMAEDSPYFLEPTIQLLTPMGAPLKAASDAGQARTFATLPADGVYTIFASDQGGDETGPYGLFLQRTSNPGNATPIAYGNTIASGISKAGEIDTYTFTAAAGDLAIVRLTETSPYFLEPLIELFTPTGDSLISDNDIGQAAINKSLPEGGRYTILVSDYYPGDDIGDYGLFLQRAFNPGNSTALAYGNTITSSISQVGEIDTYTFTASAGDVVVARLTEDSPYSSEPFIELFTPQGALLSAKQDVGQARIRKALPETGLYTILVSDGHPGEDIGSYGIFLQRTSNPGNAVSFAYGDTKAGSISGVGEVDTYSFGGRSGDKITLRMSENSPFFIEPFIELFNPQGDSLIAASNSAQAEMQATLPSTGTYTVLASDDYPGEAQGDYGLFIFGIPSTNKSLHVSVTGSDDNSGAALAPLRNISTALLRAAEGDTIKIGAGIYSETVVPQFKIVLLGGYASGFFTSGRDIFANKTVLQAVNTTMLADTKGCTIDGFVFDGNDLAETALDLNAAATVSHNLITGIRKGNGYGAEISGPVVFVNNTIDSCIRAISVSGGQGSSVVIKNNIVTNNNFGLVGIISNSAYRYNDFFKNIFNYTSGGVPGLGDISLDPKYLDPVNGDYRVNNTSPTLDAGDPADPFSAEPAPNGGRINMGTYGGTNSATSKLSAPLLVLPADGATELPLPPTLSWSASLGATSYRLQVATEVLFPSPSIVFDDSTITATAKQVPTLASNTTYYWRVHAKNLFGTSVYSSVFRFTTSTSLTLREINPASGNRLQTLNVVFTGTNFGTGLPVNVGPGINLNTVTVNSDTQLTANITITATAVTGPRSFSVSTSNSATFTVNNPVPTLTGVSPAAGIAGQTLDVVFTGTNFLSDATTVAAGAGITVNSVAVNNNTSLTANLTITSAAATGDRNFSVTNSGPGGGISAIRTFTVQPSPVTLTNLSPVSGNRLQRLNVAFTGTNFTAGLNVIVGPGITVNSSTVNSSTDLTADLTITAAAATGPRSFSVGASNNQIFTVNNPAPTLTSISPDSGSVAQTLDVVFTGSNFLSDATTVNVGSGITINSITVSSATSLTANITISPSAAIGTRSFSLTNSAPGGGTSTMQTFKLREQTMTLASISPVRGNRLETLEVVFTGTNFSSGNTVKVGPGIIVNSSTVNSSTQLTANLTITSAAATGPHNFSVETSNSQIFTIENPAPSLIGIDPATSAVDRTLDVVFTGTSFFSDATTVNVGDGITVNSITVESITSLTASITIAAAATPGNRNFSVTNAAPGGGTSLAQTFTVKNDNEPPIVLNAITDQRLRSVGATFARDLNTVFNDPEDDAMTFTASSNAENVALVALPSGSSMLTVTAIAPGMATITLTANDGAHAPVATIFVATVNAAPILTHVPSLLQPGDQSLTVSINVTDDGGLADVQLYYRRGGEPAFTEAIMAFIGGNSYQANIPVNAVTSRGVEYFAVATDLDNVQSRLPQSGVFSIQVQVTGETKPSALASGSAATAYRLISIPLQLDDPSTAAILEDDLGAYDNTKWRLFGLAPDATSQDTTNKRPFVEFPNVGANAFVPGQSLLLIVKEPGKFVTIGSAKSVKTDGEYSITLRPGHNFVATPFNFISPKVRLQSGGVVVLHTYAGNWVTANEMVPWQGYYIANNSTINDTLWVNPDLRSGLSGLRTVASSNAKWRIQILARCGEARDTENFAGVGFTSKDAWDETDLVEPPPVGDFVSLYFQHTEWQKLFHRYGEDMRSPETLNHRWDFMVESNFSHEMVTLQFDGLREMEARLALYLVDEEMNYKQNLRERTIYEYQSHGLDKPKRLRLVVGREDYVLEETANFTGVPEDFVLEQNFPNPFNPETAILFGLPEESAVTIKIFDLAGREVATVLEHAELPAGRHQRVWDGRDAQGRTVGSGVYFYRLLTVDGARTRKMVVVR